MRIASKVANRLLMKEQHEPKALHGLNRHGSAVDRIDGLLQEIVGEGTKSGIRSWHSGFLSLPGSFGNSPPSTKSLP
jgi:hypothetical protein